MSQSIASKPRRQQTEPDDVVMARALHAVEWARRNVILVVSVTVALVILVGGILWYRMDRSRRLEDAAIAFLPVEQAVLAGEETTAMQELQSFIQRHGDTPYGYEARMLLAQVHLRGNRPAEAIEAVAPVAEEVGASPIGAQAALLLAAAQESAGQRDAAIATYRRVGAQAETDLRREEGLAGAAMLLEESGDHAGAAALYRQLVDMNADTPDEAVFRMRLTEAEAQAAAQ